MNTTLISVQNLQEGDMIYQGRHSPHHVDEVVFKGGGYVQVHMNNYTASTTYEYGEKVKIVRKMINVD